MGILLFKYQQKYSIQFDCPTLCSRRRCDHEPHASSEHLPSSTSPALLPTTTGSYMSQFDYQIIIFLSIFIGNIIIRIKKKSAIIYLFIVFQIICREYFWFDKYTGLRNRRLDKVVVIAFLYKKRINRKKKSRIRRFPFAFPYFV